MSNFETLREIGEKFRLEGELYSVDVITNGNINSTYKVTYRKGSDYLKSYIFQRVNTGVFHNPIDIMENIDKVTTYMREHFPNDVYLHFHHTDTGENYYIIDDFFWRVMNYVDSITFNTLDDLTVIASVGEAFGKFQMQLAGFDGSLLHETIPNFHNTHKRLDKFLKTVEEDPCGRVKDALPEILYIKSVKETAENLSLRYDSGEIPKRVTHNDTKANNVLFDRDTK